jgi:hypothetical protein
LMWKKGFTQMKSFTVKKVCSSAINHNVRRF